MRVLWRRAPGMLVHFPQAAAAIVAAAAVMAISGVVGPLFLYSTESASLQAGVEQAGRWTAGFRLNIEPYQFTFEGNVPIRELFPAIEKAKAAMADVFDEEVGLEGPYTTILSGVFEARSDAYSRTVRLLSRDEALDQITMISGSQAGGVLISDVMASVFELEVGDRFEIASTFAQASPVVAGIYRSLQDDIRDYWTPLGPHIFREGDTDPAQLVLGDRSTIKGILMELRDVELVRFEFPLVTENLSLATGQRLAARFDDITEQVNTPSSDLAKAFTGPLSPTQNFFAGPLDAESAIQNIVSTAEVRTGSVTPAVDLLAVAARLIGGITLAAAGFYLVKTRRTEAALLVARGVGPLRQATRFGAEALLPAGLGAVLGTGAGYLMVTTLGPEGSIPASALRNTFGNVALFFGVGVLLLSAAAALAVRNEEKLLSGQGPKRGMRKVLLVAGALSAIAAVVVARLRTEVSAESIEDLSDARVTIVPVVLILAGGVVAGAVLQLVLPFVARTLRYRAPGLYLAARRLSGASAMTLVLVATTAVALGIGIYGWTMSSSVEESAASKAKLFMGSETMATVLQGFELPEDLPFDATHVLEVQRAPVPDGGFIKVLAIDPETFADAAFWRDDFGPRPLEAMMQDLDRDGLSVIMVGVEGGRLTLGTSTDEVNIDVQDTVQTFPRMPQTKPMAVMSQEDLSEVLSSSAGFLSSDELMLARADDQVVEREFAKRNISLYGVTSQREVLDTPSLQSLLWMLGLLAALGVVAGVVSLVGLMLYLQARQRTALIASALTRRMGLGRGQELRSWFAEVGGAFMLAFLVAVTVGLWVAIAMKDPLDPRPNLPPNPVLSVPVVLLIATSIALLVISAITAWLLRRRIDSANVAEAFRT